MQGKPVKDGVSPGEKKTMLYSNQSLVIRPVERETAGNYTCIAVNRMGESTSLPLHLHVKCKLLLLLKLIRC